MIKLHYCIWYKSLDVDLSNEPKVFGVLDTVVVVKSVV